MKTTVIIIGILAVLAAIVLAVFGIWVPFVIVFGIIALVSFAVVKAILIIPQNHVAVIELLGEYYDTFDAGFHLIAPFGIMKVKGGGAIFLGEDFIDLFSDKKVVDFKDASASVKARLYFKIENPYKSVYEISDVFSAMEEKTESAIRAYMSKQDLDHANQNKAELNLPSVMMGAKLPENDTTHQNSPIYSEILGWGVRVKSIVVSDIEISAADLEIRRQMLQADKDLERARMKRKEKIVGADGDKKAAILVAQGKEEAIKLEGKGQKEAWKEQLDYLSSKLGSSEAAEFMKNYHQWDNIGENAVIIDNGNGGMAGNGAKFSAGMNTNRNNRGGRP